MDDSQDGSPRPNNRILLLLATGTFLLLLLIVLAWLVFSLVVYGIEGGWERFGFSSLGYLRMLPPFGDLRWITAASACGVDMDKLLQGTAIGCDPYGRIGSSYPPMSVWIPRLLGIRGEHTGLLGASLGLAMLATILLQVRSLVRSTWLWASICTGILMGLPLQLALERSNLDVPIFLILTLLSLVLASGSIWLFPFRILLSAIPISFKIYPLLGLVGWLALPPSLGGRGRERFLNQALPVLVGCGLGMAFVLPWFPELRANVPRPWGHFLSHGFWATSRVIQLATEVWGPSAVATVVRSFMIMKIVLIGLGAFLCWRFRLADLLDELFSDGRATLMTRFHAISASIMGWTWLSCFYLSSSYDYRMIFLLPSVGHLAGMLDLDTSRHWGAKKWRIAFLCVLIGCFLLSGWNFYFYTMRFQEGLAFRVVGFASEILELITDFIFLPFYAGAIAWLLLENSSTSHAVIAIGNKIGFLKHVKLSRDLSV